MFKKNEINKNLVGAIQSHLDDQNISYDDLAYKMCYHTDFIKKMMSGNYCFTLQKIVEIGHVLNVKLLTIQIDDKLFTV